VNSEIGRFLNSDRAQISAKSDGFVNLVCICRFDGLTNDGLYPLVWPNKYTSPFGGKGNRLGIGDRNQIPVGVGDEPYLCLEESQIDR
jgi:hypothetical protein